MQGLAYSEEDRINLGLRGLLPAAVRPVKLQVEAVLDNLKRYGDDLSRYLFLRELQVSILLVLTVKPYLLMNLNGLLSVCISKIFCFLRKFPSYLIAKKFQEPFIQCFLPTYFILTW